MFRIGIIGCGYWGPNLIRNFTGLDDCVVAAVCDPRGDRLAAMQKAYPGLRTFTNDVEFVKSRLFDAVVISTPVSTHYSLAVLALESGYPVIY